MRGAIEGVSYCLPFVSIASIKAGTMPAITRPATSKPDMMLVEIASEDYDNQAEKVESVGMEQVQERSSVRIQLFPCE